MSSWDGGHRGPGWVGLTVGLVLVVVGGLALLGSLGAIAAITATMVLAVALLAVGTVVVIWALVPSRHRPASVTIDRDGAAGLALVLAYGGGVLSVGAAAPGGPLVSASSNHADIHVGVERDGAHARVRLGRDVAGWTRFEAGTWRVQAAADVPIAFELQGGAGRFDLDLAGFRLVSAGLHVGASDVRCRLPAPVGDVRVRIEAGAASVRLEIPPGVAFRVRSEGLMSRSGPSETAGYDAASDRLTIEMSGGAASLTIV